MKMLRMMFDLTLLIILTGVLTSLEYLLYIFIGGVFAVEFTRLASDLFIIYVVNLIIFTFIYLSGR